MTTSTTLPDPAKIRELSEQEKQHEPGRLPGEIAAAIGVTETQLLAARVGHGVTRLRFEWQTLLGSLGQLGKVHTVTRNCDAGIEKNGAYPEFQHFHVHSMFVGGEIDLRIKLGACAFAVVAAGGTAGLLSRSLQFYGRAGAAVHNLFLNPPSSVEPFDGLTNQYRDPRWTATLSRLDSGTER